MINIKHPASLRDPAGYLVNCGNRLIRVIRPEFVNEYQMLLSSPWLLEQCKVGTIAAFRILENYQATRLLGSKAANCLCLEHEVICFPSYPTEWPLEMLCAAAELTLKLCLQSLQNGVGLKDATPFNVLFLGSKPIFVDLLSFETRFPNNPIWLAYGQFVRSFLLPVLLDACIGISCGSTFLKRRDGIEPEDVYRFLSPLARFTPPFIGNVTIPYILSTLAERPSSKIYIPKSISNPDQATFILQSLFSRLLRTIKSSSLRKHRSNVWTTYTESCTYTETDIAHKMDFVMQFLDEFRPARVLDVGCNTGTYSFLAVKYGAEVVATDLDPEVVGNLWQRANKEQADILPLVVNLANPTPAQGWRNCETLSFLERAEGYFDAVLMLAVVHHLFVTDQIPLEEIITQASRLTIKWLIIEYVGPDDPQFIRLLRGREGLFSWFGREVFEKELGKHFNIIRQDEIKGNGRWLYLARKIID